ncbi:MAG: hypothetical protein AB1486_14250 [Planctomycetota bacterium]
MTQATPDEGTVVVFRAAFVPQACLIKTLHEEHGIPASVNHPLAVDGMIDYGEAINVRVLRERYEEARRIIAEAREVGRLLAEHEGEIADDEDLNEPA